MTVPTRPRRRTARDVRAHAAVFSALTAIGVLLAMLVPAAAASAASYQFWGYYHLTGTGWTFAQKGATETTPAEGSVEGWRWAVGDDGGATPRTPRAVVSFATVCGQVPAEAGTKRVAVIVDYGRVADGDPTTAPPEPTADCAVVPTAATGAEVLASVASVRNGTSGIVCGINDYPATGCGGPVAGLTDAQKAADTSVTIGTTATPQVGDPASTTSTPSAGGLPTATITPGVGPSGGSTAGPLASAPTSAGGSGVPAVVWVGLAILLAGVLALVWSAYRRRAPTP